MHFRNITLFFLFAMLLLSSCGKEGSDPNPEESGGGPSSEFVVPTVIPNGDENYLTTNSDYIFDQEKLHTFKLIIPNSAYDRINNDPAAEIYVECMLVFEGDTISPVGVRYKGSIGAFVNCLSGNNVFNPSGSKTCTKLSMKVKINWKDREENFFKLKKLQFHSMNNDPSQMRERLGYHLFREMGVPGPRAVHARLVINDEFVGVFALVEQVDNRFVKYNFDDDEGNLYKEVWPLTMDGFPQSNVTYLSALKTNEDDNPSVEIIRNFAEQLSTAGSSEVNAIVEEHMDIEKIISYAVVDRTIRHDDGPFHWYCSGGGCSSHNFFWYEEPTAKKLHLIPWDLDNAFENIQFDANPVTPIADDWGETRNDCAPFSYGGFGLQQWSAACDKLTQSWTSYESVYCQKKQELIGNTMSESSTQTLLDTWENQIRTATVEADARHDDAISVGTWQGAMDRLKDQLDFARNN